MCTSSCVEAFNFFEPEALYGHSLLRLVQLSNSLAGANGKPLCIVVVLAVIHYLVSVLCIEHRGLVKYKQAEFFQSEKRKTPLSSSQI